MAAACPLCDKLNRLTELPDDELVWQFPHSVALLGPWQYYTGYCILVSRLHHGELHQMSGPVRSADGEPAPASVSRSRRVTEVMPKVSRTRSRSAGSACRRLRFVVGLHDLACYVVRVRDPHDP